MNIVVINFCSHCGRMRAFADPNVIMKKQCQECLQGEMRPMIAQVVESSDPSNPAQVQFITP